LSKNNKGEVTRIKVVLNRVLKIFGATPLSNAGVDKMKERFLKYAKDDIDRILLAAQSKIVTNDTSSGKKSTNGNMLNMRADEEIKEVTNEKQRTGSGIGIKRRKIRKFIH
jgi:hypothetical protein